MNGKLVGFILSIFALGASAQVPAEVDSLPKVEAVSKDKPAEGVLQRAASRRFDLRSLPQTRPVARERVELEDPEHEPVMAPGSPPPQPAGPSVPTLNAPAPPPLNVFEGLDRFNWGAGSPPDTNGDVGPTHYIQTVNTSVGIFRKTDGFLEAGFSFNTFMSQGNFGNLCDTDNFGDPVVLYDTFEDRWIITDFAFKLDGSGNVVVPAYQCVAASMSGDPIAGGWSFYSRLISDNLNDYPKFGIWPDGLYMSANMFSFGAGSSFRGARAWAFNKAQMYAGAPTAQVVSFDIGGGDFTVVPSNARLQTGTPPPGSPNLFVSSWLFTNALTVYKFHVDWNSISLSTFSGPDVPIAATSWPNAAVANAAQPGTATLLDVLQIRAMVQNQYTNFGGAESLWVPHTVRRAAGGLAAPRWYQVNVTGGTVAAALPQAATWDPDGANVINRFMPSLALDRGGDLAMGYSTSNGTAFPSMAYAGRLAGDPVNTFSKTEQTLFSGTASQTGTTRWGDYSAMTLDPDGCTFWYTNEYANPADQTFDHRWLTKFGSFTYTECTPFGAGGTISGAVTTNPGGAPISGATVQLGARTTTTDGSGNYSYSSIPAGTYPTISASKPGFGAASASSIVVTDGGTTTQNFSLTAASTNACLIDTTQADFLTGVATNLDLNTSPGDVTLSNAPFVDQSNTAGTNTGTSFGTPNWTGQTFIPAVTGTLVKADIQLFSTTTGTTPNLTLSVRATSGGLPTGADLASGTIPGFNNGAGVYYTVTFGSPATLTSGTQYALILRPVAAPSVAGYFWIRSSPSTYANGSRVTSTDSGGTWATDTTRDFNFRAYMQTGYAASGDLISSAKDANPPQDYTATWSTFSWTASTPANTSLSFQAAATNSAFDPFNFVGPDGTAATFFTTSGSPLSQFNGNRYLKYRAYLATSDTAATPVLNDVTLCYSDLPPPATNLKFTTQPTDGTAGQTLAAVAVSVENSLGNVVTTDNTTQVTLALSSNSLNGTVTQTAVNGVATFSDLSISVGATGYTLSASSNPALTGDTSTPFNIALTVTAASGGNGTITPASQTVNSGSTASFVVTPAATYHVLNVTGDTCTVTQQGATTTWISSAISANCAVTATFAIDTFTVTAASGGNGTITPPSQSVNSGSAASFTVTPDPTYHVVSVTGDTCTVLHVSGNNWSSSAISADCAVTATFAINTYIVTTNTIGGNGTITPPSQTVNSGSTAAFVVTPASGYHVASVTGNTCTVTQGVGNNWASSAITTNCAVIAKFAVNVLVFTTQPANLTRGDALGAVVVAEQDGSGNTIIDNSSSVDFTIAACGGSVDLGNIAMVNGVATLNSTQVFYTLTSTPGLQINATTGTFNGTSQFFNVLPNSDLPFADGFEACRL